jgi:hypothetical protein
MSLVAATALATVDLASLEWAMVSDFMEKTDVLWLECFNPGSKDSTRVWDHLFSTEKDMKTAFADAHASYKEKVLNKCDGWVAAARVSKPDKVQFLDSFKNKVEWLLFGIWYLNAPLWHSYFPLPSPKVVLSLLGHITHIQPGLQLVSL